MGWFDRLFDPDKVPEGNAKALMRIAAGRSQRRRRAIYALADVQFTDELFVFLQKLLDDPAVADAAVSSLGRNADPRGKRLALNIARSGGPLAKAAAASIGFDLRPPAELLEEATTSGSYHVVERAVGALAAWNTPEADQALKIFQEGTRRDLFWERVEPLDGTGQYYVGEGRDTFRSSRDLGQQPTAEERELEHRTTAEGYFQGVCANLLKLGQPEDIIEYARRCLEEPGNIRYRFGALKGYLEQAPNNAIASELQRHIDKGDRTKLEKYLLEKGESDSIALLELLHCNNLWERLLECEREFWRQNPVKPREATARLCARFPEEMAQILLQVILQLPVSSPVTVVAATSLGYCKSCAVPQLKPVVDKLRLLLADPHWTTRRQALMILLPIRDDRARDLLRDYLAIETDFELQTLAKEFLQTVTKL